MGANHVLLLQIRKQTLGKFRSLAQDHTSCMYWANLPMTLSKYILTGLVLHRVPLFVSVCSGYISFTHTKWIGSEIRKSVSTHLPSWPLKSCFKPSSTACSCLPQGQSWLWNQAVSPSHVIRIAELHPICLFHSSYIFSYPSLGTSVDF